MSSIKRHSCHDVRTYSAMTRRDCGRMERRAHARPQPAPPDGDGPQTLFTNWGCRGKRVAPRWFSLHAVPCTGAPLLTPPSKPGRTAHSAPDELRGAKGSRHSSASFPFGRRTRPNFILHTLPIHEYKNTLS